MFEIPFKSSIAISKLRVYVGEESTLGIPIGIPILIDQLELWL